MNTGEFRAGWYWQSWIGQRPIMGVAFWVSGTVCDNDHSVVT